MRGKKQFELICLVTDFRDLENLANAISKKQPEFSEPTRQAESRNQTYSLLDKLKFTVIQHVHFTTPIPLLLPATTSLALHPPLHTLPPSQDFPGF